MIILFYLSFFVSHPFTPNNQHPSVFQFFPYLLLLLILLQKNFYKNFIKIVSKKNDKPVLILLFLFFTYLISSLLYTQNLSYGLTKVYGLLFYILPLSVSFAYIIYSFKPSFLKKMIDILILTGCILSILLVLHGELKYDNTNNFYYWSHVGLGKFLGFALISNLVMMIKNYKDKKYLYIIFFIIIFQGVFLSGLRSAFIGIVLITLFVIIINLTKKRISYQSVVLSFMLMIITILPLFIYSNNFNIVFNRYENLLEIKDTNHKIIDSSILARKEIIPIEMNMIKHNPILGMGIGGFNTYYTTDLPLRMKYPHNIFLEITTELGIIGLILFLLIIYKIIDRVYKNKLLLYLLLFALWLSFFTGNIIDQVFIFLFFPIIVSPILNNKINQIIC